MPVANIKLGAVAQQQMLRQQICHCSTYNITLFCPLHYFQTKTKCKMKLQEFYIY